MGNYKFRAWNKRRKVMFDVFGLDVNHVYGFIDDDKCSTAIPPDREDVVLMQYTGLNDKNGTEICTGDILEIVEPRMEGSNVQHTEVVFNNGAYMVKEPGYNPEIYLSQINKRVAIVGNRYENFELLSEAV